MGQCKKQTNKQTNKQTITTYIQKTLIGRERVVIMYEEF